MSSYPPPPSRASGAAPLRTRRCTRHREREAVARCPSCVAYYCRECVVDHGGRLMCAACLARETALPRPAPRPVWRTRLARTASLAGAALLAWFFFYTLGSLLLRIPPEVHEKSYWQREERGHGWDD